MKNRTKIFYLTILLIVTSFPYYVFAQPQENEKEPITRANIAILFNRAVEVCGQGAAKESLLEPFPPILCENQPSKGSPFSDISSQDCAYEAIVRSQVIGLIEGFHGLFRPKQPMTRYEFSVVIARLASAMGIRGTGTSYKNRACKFSDVETTHWAYEAIIMQCESGILQGYPDGSFKGKKPVTVEEAKNTVTKLIDWAINYSESAGKNFTIQLDKTSYKTDNKISLIFSGNVERILVKLYSVDMFSMAKNEPNFAITNLAAKDFSYYQKLIKEETIEPASTHDKSYDLPSGTFLIEASSGPMEKRLFFTLSDLDAVVGYVPNKISIYPYSKNSALNPDTTYEVLIRDSQEVLSHTKIQGRELVIHSDIPSKGAILIKSGENIALFNAESFINIDNSPMNFLKAYLYTDRPVYRPSQTVHFKGVILRDDIKNILLKLYNARNQVIYEKIYILNAFHTFSSSFPLGDTIPIGTYYFEIQTPNTEPMNFMFDVQEYTKKDFEVSVVSDKSDFAPSDDKIFSIQAKYLFGKPMQNAAVTYELYRQNVRMFEKSLVTDAGGKAKIDLSHVILDGSYTLLVKARDKAGGEAQSSMPFSITFRSEKLISITPDNDAYIVGDKAKITFESFSDIQNALITITGNRVFTLKTSDFSKNTTHEENVEITEDFYPSFYVIVRIPLDLIPWQKGKYITISKKINVKRKEDIVQVNVKTNKEFYEPREDINFAISTSNIKGNPVMTDLSFGLVDKAVYEIKKDSDISDYFFTPTATHMSVSEDITDEYSPPFDIRCSWGHVYGMTAATVDSGTSAPKIENIEIKDKGKEKPIFVRSYFPDTAYWNAHIFTDENGKASVTLPLPDSLTTWVAKTNAVAQNFAYGSATKEVITQKPVILRIVAPPFFTERDEIEISTLAHNYSNKDIKARIEVQAFGAAVISGHTQKANISANSYVEQRWKLKINTSHSVIVSAAMATGKQYDAMRITVPVTPHGLKIIKNIQGTLQAKETKEIMSNENIPQNTESVMLFLSSPFSPHGIMESLQYLITYPYGCVEQTMSKFFPLIAALSLYEATGYKLQDEDFKKKTEDMVYSGLQRLYSFQNKDGGWGWWNDGSDIYMSSYVLYGFFTARQNGFYVNEGILSSGTSFIEKKLNEMKSGKEKLLPLFVLSHYKSIDTNVSISLQENSLSLWEKAMLAMIYKNSGSEKEAQKIIQSIGSATEDTKTGTAANKFINHPLEHKALLLLALTMVDPENSLAFSLLNELLSQRTGNHWVSTKTTAFVLLAYTEFLKKFYKHDANPVEIHTGSKLLYSLDVNDKVIGKTMTIDIDEKDLIKTKSLRLTNKGNNTLYYDLALHYFTKEDNVFAGGRGIHIKKIMDGENITVNFSAEEGQPNVILEDYLPSCCEADLSSLIKPAETVHFEKRDNRMVFFFSNLSTGDHSYNYKLKKIYDGKFHAMPAIIYPMYDPDVRGNSNEMLFEFSSRNTKN